MASKRAIRRKACGDKVKYPTQEAALEAIATHRTRISGYYRMNVYPCAFGRHWHKGHAPYRRQFYDR